MGSLEVERFLKDLGLESCVQAVVHNGFYTSMEALRGANYEELVDSGVRPVHAKLILSNLGSKGGYGGVPLASPGGAGAAEEVGHFLRSVGLENCASQLAEGGFTTLDRLSDASLQQLLDAGLKPVHARLIVSNLDSASSIGFQTPASQRLAALDAEESLLLAPSTKKRPRRVRLILCVVLAFFVAAAAYHVMGGGGAPQMAVGSDAPGETAGSVVASVPAAAVGGGESKHKGGLPGKHHGGGGGGGAALHGKAGSVHKPKPML
jgi:hypothetical protein